LPLANVQAVFPFLQQNLRGAKICCQRSAANEKRVRFHFPVSHQSVMVAQTLGHSYSQLGSREAKAKNGGVGWNLLAPWKRKTDSSTAPKAHDPTGTPTRTGDLRPGEQLGTLAMNVFLNQGSEGRLLRHAAIPINPISHQAVEAQAANDSIPQRIMGFVQPGPFCPDEAVPCAAPTQPRATPYRGDGGRLSNAVTSSLNSTHAPLGSLAHR
jgi:hypothetical protein